MKQTDDMQKGLPDNIISLVEVLEVRGYKKFCPHNRFIIDAEKRRVECKDCGDEVTAFDALEIIAKEGSWYRARIEELAKQRKQLLDWQPHLIAVRELERMWRGRKILPICPRCQRGITAEELANSGRVSMKLETARRNHEKQ